MEVSNAYCTTKHDIALLMGKTRGATEAWGEADSFRGGDGMSSSTKVFTRIREKCEIASASIVKQMADS